MHRLAGTAPGLENERMQELVRGSHLLHDKSLLTDIRKMAWDIGARVEQKGPEIDSRVDALENRVRLAMRIDGSLSGPAVPAGRTPDGSCRRSSAAVTASSRRRHERRKHANTPAVPRKRAKRPSGVYW